jgi:Tfp pilus assembly protein PilE
MGTQQILLIVLSVIIVGVAVAVGIQMFNTQAMNSNRQAVVGDLQTLGAQVMQYYRTPSSQGGAGSSIGTGDASDVATFIGWSGTVDTTDTGTFTLTTPAANTVRIVGVGTETGNDGSANVQATLTVTCTSSSPLSTTINN